MLTEQIISSLLITFTLLMIVTAIKIINTSNLTNAVILSGLFSLLSVFTYNTLKAPDVAITEAAVGSFISTAFFFLTLAILRPKSHIRITKYRLSKVDYMWSIRILTTIAFLTIIGTVVSKMPNFGDPISPANIGVAKQYLESAYHDFGGKNIVTAVLGGYRALDTLFETTVIFCAAFGVHSILKQNANEDSQ